MGEVGYYLKQKRSEVMASVKSSHTQPELDFRRLVHAMGFRYRLHRADLPGRPDLVFPGVRKVVFVHRFFWHGHSGCKHAALPTDRKFWLSKLKRNQQPQSTWGMSDFEARGGGVELMGSTMEFVR